jgi:hypothetical protein
MGRCWRGACSFSVMQHIALVIALMFLNFFSRRDRHRQYNHHTQISPWQPYTRLFRGPITMRRSLERRGTSSVCSFWYICRIAIECARANNF